MMKKKIHYADALWWLGIPVLLFLNIWAPFWIRNLVTHHEAWLRVPLVYGTVFDVTAYLQGVSNAMNGLSIGGLLGPFTRLVQVLHQIFPHASPSEIWFITRWMCEVAALWIGAELILRFAGLSKNTARLFSLALWLSFVIVLGMRPAVFSWFLPLGMFGMLSVLMIRERLVQGRIISSIVWSLAGLILSSVYAWYLIFVAIWMCATWFEWLVGRSLRRALGFVALTSVAASMTAVLFSFWVSVKPAGILWLELYQRLSLSYTHAPFLSSSMLHSILWGLLLIPVTRRLMEPWKTRFTIAASAWISLVLAFLMSPFTGHFILNDHFRAPAVILSWCTLALVWGALSNSSQKLETGCVEKGLRFMSMAIFLIATGYVVRILIAPYAWNGDLLNVVQLSHWLALWIGPGLVLLWQYHRRLPSTKIFFVSLFVGLSLLAGVALSFVFTREFDGLSRLEKLSPVFDWIGTHVPVTDSLCMDHGGDRYSLDDVVSAHTGRMVHFAHTTLYLHERDQAFLDRMRTVAGFYDVRAAGDEDYWRIQSSLNQFIVCENFPVQRKILSVIGLSQDRIDDLTGCPRATIDARFAYVKQAIDHPRPNPEEFKKICPWVVVPERTKAFWHLPSDYRETRITNDVSIFSFRIQPSP